MNIDRHHFTYVLKPFSGGARAHFYGDLHHRDVHQDPGNGIHPAQEQLHEEPVEHHGFHRGHIRVGIHMIFHLL